ncbi:MAG TPA: glycosyltransferase [Candidatus Absconditabacterales bacterium]|nr:glycosyltransferase [Candidatus Absconditabacterales bacterium]
MLDKKIGILYFGRLDDEKGFGLILDVLKKFVKENGEIPFSFYVFGKGKYVQELLNLSSKHNCIHFFGRQSLETISRYKENCQFCLMPSIFLETFGLTALNSLAMGIPVVGFAKGGLKQFVSPKYSIEKATGSTDAERLYNKLNDLIGQIYNGELDVDKERKKALTLSDKYSVQRRVDSAKEIFGKPKRILLISDFKSRLGGIETYVYDAADILSQNGYEVKIYGIKIPKGKIGQLIKYFGLFFAMRNFVDAIRLSRVVRKFKPKAIRYHSTLRRLGWLPILALGSHKSKKFMMYHDLGYFHPFPKSVLQENMVKTPFTFKNFVSSYPSKNPITKFAICLKYISICLIKKQLKKTIDLHLLPSDFVTKITHESYQIDTKKVQTFSHFIQQ